MRKGARSVLVAGGAGFIGSEFTRHAVSGGMRVIVVDKLTYAGDLGRLSDIKGRFAFYRQDICDAPGIRRIFRRVSPDCVVNFAAETHVDRSIREAAPFIATNVTGAQVLLEAARQFRVKRYVQVSTDEVYGERLRGSFPEDASLKPGNPYAASKAAADLLTVSYVRTYGLAAVIVRPCNTYGPWQHPEKLIPAVITRALKNQKVPLYAQGRNLREWIYVSDCARAVYLTMEKGTAGHIYNIGSGFLARNIDVVKKILALLGKPGGQVRFVKDRPGHDFRYSLNSKKIRLCLNWHPAISFDRGLRLTVDWYAGASRRI
jgi:dTDP-glucose 4,6-dehydratase